MRGSPCPEPPLLFRPRPWAVAWSRSYLPSCPRPLGIAMVVNEELFVYEVERQAQSRTGERSRSPRVAFTGRLLIVLSRLH